MRLALALRRLMVRTARHRLAWLAWRGVMMLTARAVARYLAAGTGTTVWLRGSFGGGDSVPGLSDIDLVAATGPDELGAALTHLRRRRLDESRVGFGRLVSVDLYEPGEIERAAAVNELRFGLEGRGEPRARASRLRSRAPADELGLRLRPPLPAPWAGWRRVAGRRSLSRVPALAGPERLTAAWLELQYWWRHAVRAASSPPGDLRSYLAVKLASESARLRLWVAGEPWPDTRADALVALAALGPEEEALAGVGLETERALPAAGPRPLEPGLRALLLASQDVARRLDEAAGPGTTVALVGGEGPPLGQPEGLLPLADWRARAAPELPDEAFAPAPGDPADADALAAAGGGGLRMLRADRVLVQAGSAVGTLRGAQAPVTDPVSAALLDGESTAVFPALPGWSARDCALRAVAEHRSWLAAQKPRLYPNDRALGLLLTAARAALFLDSLDEESPSLPLTAAATANALGGQEAADGLADLTECRGSKRPADPQVLAALRTVVEALPPYAGSLS